MVTGDDVRRARGRLRLTQRQLADLLGVSRRTIAEWESSGELTATIAGRLSAVVVTDGEPDTQNAAPLAAVSDLELVSEMGRRLSSLRQQLDAAALARAAGTGTDGDAARHVGTEINDSAGGSPGFSDRTRGDR